MNCCGVPWRAVLVFCCCVAAYAQNPVHEACTTPQGQSGQCIPIYSCSYLSSLFGSAPKPLSADQIASLQSYHCGFHGATPTPKVCCPLGLPPAAGGAPPQAHQVPAVSAGQGQFDKRTLINQDNCGGKKAALAKFPWMALLAYNTSSGVSFKCGGTLINENYILTAAQCLTEHLIAVRLGEYDTSTEIDCYGAKGCAPPVQDIAISEVSRYRGYNPSTREHDIGLIRLSRPANVQSETIRPICLPLQDELPFLIGKYADITGWGVTESGYTSSKLLKVSLPIISLNDCQQRYDEKDTKVVLQGGHLCAGGLRGKDACSGDGGGPLALRNERGVFVQHGIVSFGSRYCGMEGINLPGVYTNVGKYINWILDNIRP